MKLYLDDNSAKASLVALLQKAGHQVTIPSNVGIDGVPDPRHLIYTIQNGLVLLTRNHDDFEDLHMLIEVAGGQHPGVFVVRADNDPTRDMRDGDIVRAIKKLEASSVTVANELHILNH